MRKVGHISGFPFGIYWWTLKNPKNQAIEKMKKIDEDIILHMFTKNHNHMRYGSWDLKWDRFFCSFGSFFALLTPSPSQPRKPKFLKNEKSICRRHHFRLMQQKTRWYDICLLRCGDIIFSHLRPFFALLRHYWPRKLKFGKNGKKNLEILSIYTCVPLIVYH